MMLAYKGKSNLNLTVFLFVDVAFVFAVYQLISFVILGFHERVIEYSQ